LSFLPLTFLFLSSSSSCGNLSTGAARYDGNTGSESIVTQAVDGINGNSFSVCLYVQRKRVGVEEFLLTMGAQTERGAGVLYFWSSPRMLCHLNSDYTYTSSAFPSDTGVWVHWAFVYNKVGNGMSTFRDGVAEGLAGTPGNNLNGGTSQGPSTATGPIYLGVRKWDTASNPFNGNMDELRVYADRALIQSEVSSMMTNPVTDDPGLVLSMTFDGSGANLGKDSSCRGVRNAISVTGVVSVAGKECGAEDSSSLLVCNSYR
jgi:hypothetical protein